MKTIFEVAESVAWWWTHSGQGTASVGQMDSEGNVEIILYDSDGEEFYVGDYSDPGLSISLAGDLNGCTLVRVNSIIMEALGKHIVGWAIGLQR